MKAAAPAAESDSDEESDDEGAAEWAASQPPQVYFKLSDTTPQQLLDVIPAGAGDLLKGFVPAGFDLGVQREAGAVGEVGNAQPGLRFGGKGQMVAKANSAVVAVGAKSHVVIQGHAPTRPRGPVGGKCVLAAGPDVQTLLGDQQQSQQQPTMMQAATAGGVQRGGRAATRAAAAAAFDGLEYAHHGSSSFSQPLPPPPPPPPGSPMAKIDRFMEEQGWSQTQRSTRTRSNSSKQQPLTAAVQHLLGQLRQQLLDEAEQLSGGGQVGCEQLNHGLETIRVMLHPEALTAEQREDVAEGVQEKLAAVEGFRPVQLQQVWWVLVAASKRAFKLQQQRRLAADIKRKETLGEKVWLAQFLPPSLGGRPLAEEQLAEVPPLGQTIYVCSVWHTMAGDVGHRAMPRGCRT